ncbi:MAG: DUF1122 family protein [candidate division WOR-3 bacterium]|nr:MAG: DUF1122 family protein [candidate division WOR-3 bacterium]
MLHNTIDVLNSGISVNGAVIKIHSIVQGRFREEQNVRLHYQSHEGEEYLLYVKIFHGRPPEYLPWVELYGMNTHICVDGKPVVYFDSAFEDTILHTFSKNLRPGARIFVEYLDDIETREQLRRGFPAVLSRLGYKMFKLGYTWFKDWYFPEGYLEGTQKLQAETALNQNHRSSHLKAIADDVSRFMCTNGVAVVLDEYTRRAILRAESITSVLNEPVSRRD